MTLEEILSSTQKSSLHFDVLSDILEEILVLDEKDYSELSKAVNFTVDENNIWDLLVEKLFLSSCDLDALFLAWLQGPSLPLGTVAKVTCQPDFNTRNLVNLVLLHASQGLEYKSCARTPAQKVIEKLVLKKNLCIRDFFDEELLALRQETLEIFLTLALDDPNLLTTYYHSTRAGCAHRKNLLLEHLKVAKSIF